MKKFILVATIAATMFGCQKNKSEVFSSERGAINGYDPVAYFVAQKPTPGKEDLTFEWNKAVWHFSTDSNRQLFKDNPEKYAPQFGGYCAWGTSRGYKAKTDPDAWTVVNDKLYLNYNREVQAKWLQNRDSLILKAEANWPTVRSTAFK